MIACVRCGEAPAWGVSSISYPHHPGEISHYCEDGIRVAVSLNELSGTELEWAKKLVDESAAASKANAARWAKELLTIPAPAHLCTTCFVVFHEPFICRTCGVRSVASEDAAMRGRRWNWLEGIKPGSVRDDLEQVLYAIAAWQLASGLRADGLIGEATWALRDLGLVGLAKRFRTLCEACGVTHLHTYGVVSRFLEGEGS